MGLLADVPSWYWQVLGAASGLGLGVWLGAVRQRRQRGNARAIAEVTSPGRSSARVAAAPAPTPAANAMAAPVPLAGAAAEPSTNPALQRMIERLREQNTELAGRLKAASEIQSREIQAREAQIKELRETQAREVREREASATKAGVSAPMADKTADELRQTHAAELARLMSMMVEQVDSLQVQHASRLKALEGELEALRLELGQGREISTQTTTEARSVGMSAPADTGRGGPNTGRSRRP